LRSPARCVGRSEQGQDIRQRMDDLMTEAEQSGNEEGRRLGGAGWMGGWVDRTMQAMQAPTGIRFESCPVRQTHGIALEGQPEF
jgi:hypothetical protein